MTKDESLKMRKEQDEYWSKIITQAEEALEHPTQRNFCERCGKRASKDLYHIHTCTPPQALEQPAPSWQTNKEFVLLSDNEIDKCEEKSWTLQTSIDTWEFNHIDFARAIEQALKEKNT